MSFFSAIEGEGSGYAQSRPANFRLKRGGYFKANKEAWPYLEWAPPNGASYSFLWTVIAARGQEATQKSALLTVKRVSNTDLEVTGDSEFVKVDIAGIREGRFTVTFKNDDWSMADFTVTEPIRTEPPFI